jgi:glycosyltransferase involved in cell wall biosynthesis
MPDFIATLGKARKAAAFATWRLAGGAIRAPRGISHIIESGDWVIQRVGDYLKERMPALGVDFRLERSPRFLANRVIHFGSVHGFAGGGHAKTHPSNKILMTIYHGNLGIDAGFDKTIRELLLHKDRIDHVVASTTMMRARLAEWGFAQERITVIPIGVELGAFSGPRADRARFREQLGIPADAICIGSFQKDGNGWGEGLEPKLIKGPDIFVEAVRRLSRTHKVHCLLTGPSRGYVKKALGDLGIPFTHRLLGDYKDIVDHYRCLDLYLVTSREEGGPMALMECMAAGIPLVSTRVGMAPDIIVHGENGMLADVGDVDAIVAAGETLLTSPELRKAMAARGAETVKALDWDPIASRYAAVYRKLLRT